MSSARPNIDHRQRKSKTRLETKLLLSYNFHKILTIPILILVCATPLLEEYYDEACLAVLNNKYQDGIKWHDVACYIRSKSVVHNIL